VADLLHPQSVIDAGELAPTLLSEDEEGLAAALQLFDLEQLSLLFADAERCLARCSAPPPGAAARLQQIAGQLVRLKRHSALN
jgi:hypothetical protein